MVRTVLRWAAKCGRLEEARIDLLAQPVAFESGAGDQFLSTADDLLRRPPAG